MGQGRIWSLTESTDFFVTTAIDRYSNLASPILYKFNVSEIFMQPTVDPRGHRHAGVLAFKSPMKQRFFWLFFQYKNNLSARKVVCLSAATLNKDLFSIVKYVLFLPQNENAPKCVWRPANALGKPPLWNRAYATWRICICVLCLCRPLRFYFTKSVSTDLTLTMWNSNHHCSSLRQWSNYCGIL